MQSVSSLLLPLERESLVQALVTNGPIRASALDRILSDLRYGVGNAWTSIFSQPLFVLDASRFLVAPTLVTTGMWETNLTQMWARRYSAEYSARVQTIKRKGAADIAKHLSTHGYIATANRRYGTNRTRALGDVDLACFDPRCNVLFLGEMKWLIPAAGSHEARMGDAELKKGIRQVLKAAQYVQDNSEAAAEQLFNPMHVQISVDTQVRLAVIARGHLGSFIEPHPRVPVLDYHRVSDYLHGLSDMPGLDVVADEWNKLMQDWSAPHGRSVTELSIRLGGYSIHVPAFRIVPTTIPE